jgi:hypothetical protein
MMDDPVVSALALGTSLATQFAALAVRTRSNLASEFAHRPTLVIGDPQAPFEKLLRILLHHGLLTPEGTIRPDVRLVSVGDHFDWGRKEQRAQASFDGLRTLAWLASHPAEQVIILAGNHDLARVGDLHAMDDDTFADAQLEADLAYYQRQPVRPEREFCDAYQVASWEVIARDWSAFRAAQRDWITLLLRAGRMQLAFSAHGVLCTHAGIGHFELSRLGLDGWQPNDGPEMIADAINARALRALRQWRDGPLQIEGLHVSGSAGTEGTGMLHHRFTTKPTAAIEPGALQRKAPITQLPLGLVQCIGHVRDRKSRDLLQLGPSSEPDGAARVLSVYPSGTLAYRTVDSYAAPMGPHSTVAPKAFDRSEATIFHVDGAMLDASEERYQLFSLDRLAPHVGDLSMTK